MADNWESETRSHYRDDRNLRQRQALFDFVSGSTGSLTTVVSPYLGDGVVLDLGCGNGMWPARLALDAAHPPTFVCVDVSLGMVQLARSQPVVRAVVQADACALPFADNAFDSVLALWMLYHVADKRTALRELGRVKKPNGWLIVATNGEVTSPLDELICSALATTLGRRIDAYMPPLALTADNGTEVLSSAFTECEKFEWKVSFEIDSPEAVVDVADSLRGPIELTLGQVRWPVFQAELREGAQATIRNAGHIAHVIRQAAFLAR